MSVIENPCKRDCPRRSSTCHATCKDYKEYRQALDERNALIRQERDREFDVRAVAIESRRRTLRKSNPKYKHKY